MQEDDLGGVQESVESHIEDENCEEDLNMPDHIVKRRNDTIKEEWQ